MRTQRSADRILGIAAGLLGALVIVSARGIERQAGEGLTPRAFPVVIALALLASGAAVAVAAWRRTEDGRTLDWPSRDGFLRMGVVLAATAVYVASLSAAGFPLASLLFVTGLTAYLGRGGWPSAVAAGSSACPSPQGRCPRTAARPCPRPSTCSPTDSQRRSRRRSSEPEV